jgi:hypothetical protein
MTFKEQVQAELKAEPNKSNRGRKPMNFGDRKATVQVFPTNSQVDAMGGKEAAQKWLTDAIDRSYPK